MIEPRSLKLKAWMDDYDITWEAVGEQFGISGAGARAMLRKEAIQPERHAQLIKLGFPEELLPIAYDLRRGPVAKKPRFPGLVEA